MNNHGSFGICGLCEIRKGKSAMAAHLKRAFQAPATAPLEFHYCCFGFNRATRRHTGCMWPPAPMRN